MSIHRVFLVPSILRLICSAIVIMLMVLPAQAISLLRDADLEHGLKQLASPVLRAAGLNPNRVKVLIVDDPNLNAFVVSQDAIFIHSGLITKLETASQLQGVIAHEAAHIANGHLTRRLTNLGVARTATGLGIALAAIAAAAGGADVAGPIAIGSASSAQRLFLKHTRAEEASADQSAARYMRSSGVNPGSLAEVMEIFSGQDALSEASQDPYVRSHPLTRDRLRALRAYAATVEATPENPQAAYWFARTKGKLNAYKRPKWVLRRLKDTSYKDLSAMGEAVALHQQSRTKKALAAVDRAIASRPTDPFFHDLKGEILIESRNFRPAVAAYARAVQLAPRDALILSGYGRALLANGETKKALNALEKSNSIDYRDGSMLRDLSVAYAKSGQPGMAALAIAEQRALRGQIQDAAIHAKRASDLLPRGSGPWQRAQDVLNAAERFAKQRKR
ncbi:MAG: M48 family metalloprotease [Aliishimia sp.]